MDKIFKRSVAAVLMAVFLVLVLALPHASAYDIKQVWVRTSATAGETLTLGQLVCIKDADGYAYKADANDSALRPAVGIVGKSTASGSSVEIVTQGVLSGWSTLSEGTYGYLSETAGAVTQSAPSYAQIVGVAISQTQYLFNFSSYLDSSAVTAIGVLSGATPLEFEGATADAYETTVAVTDPTADRTVTIPDETGNLLLFANPNTQDVNVIFEGATADAHETTVTVTDPTADRTVTIPDSDVNLGAIANALLAAPKSYFTIALSINGQETATVDPAATFQMPFAATLVEVSVAARDIDTADADETYTVDLEEAGTTVLSSAISIAADNTPVVGTISDSAIADNAKMEVVLTIGGTTPTIDDLTVLLTFKVAHTS